ncbi:cytochrome o ubiquinol oxidase subunit III [Fictibacillus sp. FJAT-27399]|uniref:cytochrome o ubiquinol oxidase subunit III n=1 Tax=Fictibacillus sp. FJAT-27399 TaxID=1729689 RepID=UPI000784BBDA|nr:cytochrome o ubiquinol oxidase subunit III [Fictibacillus sp. FJAT-27399]
MAQSVTSMDTRHEAHHDTFKLLGFWIFLVTDCIIFACLFAVYAVLRTHTDGDLTGHELFEVKGFTAETFILLASSFTSGLASLAMHKGNKKQLMAWLAVTVLLGMSFVGLEIMEFAKMAAEGATISTNAFLSSFFTLVGTHGLHVTFGLIWMIGVMVQIGRHGIDHLTKEKVTIVGLYWHFLDVVWIFIFTVVYLLGVM